MVRHISGITSRRRPIPEAADNVNLIDRGLKRLIRISKNFFPMFQRINSQHCLG